MFRKLQPNAILKAFVITEKDNLNDYRIVKWRFCNKRIGCEPESKYRHKSLEPPTLEEVEQEDTIKEESDEEFLFIEEEQSS